MIDLPRNGSSLGRARPHAASGIQGFLSRVVRETGVPGIAVAIRSGAERLSIAAGRTARGGPPISTAHRFHAGCAIKLLEAVVTLELAARGTLALDAVIGEPLPELRGTIHGETVRVAHLLSHTSGYRGVHLLDPEAQQLDWPGLIAHLRASPQLFPPGAVFGYEHTESVLLGRILERATARDPLALVAERLLEPLGLVPGRLDDVHDDPLWAGRHDLDRASGRFVPISSAPRLSPFWNAAFSDFTLSVADLAEIAHALLPDGPDASGATPRAAEARTPPVSEETRNRLREAAVRLPPAFGGPVRELLPTAFGLGAAEFCGGLYGHNGLTYGQCVGVRYSPTEHVAIAIGMNAMLPHLRDHVLDAIWAELFGRPPARPSPPFELDLAAFAGRYVGPGRSAVTANACADGRLALEIAHGEHRLPIDVVVDDARNLVVHAPLPQLSIGFFHAPAGEPALLLGASAYKRVASVAPKRSSSAARRPATRAAAEIRS
ncbi:MAG TPA: serine hydrolase domain-containing protein [Gammaproteobacteria bacterium]